MAGKPLELGKVVLRAWRLKSSQRGEIGMERVGELTGCEREEMRGILQSE